MKKIQQKGRLSKRITVALLSGLLIANSFTAIANAETSRKSPDFSNEKTSLSLYPSYAIAIENEYKQMFPENEEMIKEIISNLLNNESYAETYRCDEQMAIKSMRSTLETALFASNNSGITTMGADYHGNFYANYTVPVVTQKNNYYCGPASLIQALIGNGFWTNTASNKTEKKQESTILHMMSGNFDTIDAYMNTNGTRPFMMTNAINYYSSEVEFIHENVTRYTTGDATILKMKHMLIDGYCPIVSIPIVKNLSYYGENYEPKSGHWVTVSAINDINKTITLVDPNNNSSYRGIHIVTYEEFFNALGTVDGWIIYND